MLINEHKNLASDLVKKLVGKGVETAVVEISYNTENEVSVREQKIETLSQANSKELKITISKDKKKAMVKTCDFAGDALKGIMDDALNLVNYTGSDEFYDLPEKDELGTFDGDLNTFDPETEKVPTEKRIEMAKTLEDKTLKIDRELISDGSSVNGYNGHTVLANSLGFCEGYPYSANTLVMSCAVPDTNGGLNSARKQSGYWYDVAIHFDKLAPIEEIAEKAAMRTLKKRGAKKPATQEVPVIFENTIARTFLRYISAAASGGNIYRKSSFLLDKLGEKIADEKITIIDDPHMPGYLGSKPFDDEGVKTRKKAIIEKGVLKNYLLDSYSARKLEMKTSGNAGGTGNLYMESGENSFKDLIESTGKGVLVTSFSGHGANIQNGDFSMGAQGFWIENGKIAYPVSEFTVASTFFDILGNIEMIANDPLLRSSTFCPAFKIRKMTVSGT